MTGGRHGDLGIWSQYVYTNYAVNVCGNTFNLALTSQQFNGALEVTRAEYSPLDDLGSLSATERTEIYQALRSFVMTEEIAGGVPADSIAPPLAAIGKLTRQFHDAGFIHKDYYLCHIFVAGEALYFIDLQRVLGPGKFSRRWIVKDLAALAHSAERIGLPHEELLRAYGVDEALRRKIAARRAWLRKRRPRYVGVWDDPEKSRARF